MNRIVTPRENRIHMHMVPPHTPFPRADTADLKQNTTAADAGQTALPMAQFLAFVPKTPAFYVYMANARSSPKVLRFKYMRRTRVRPQNPCVFSICAAPPVRRRARRAPGSCAPKPVRFKYM